MKGVKNTVGVEKGDIVRSNGSVTIYEISDSKAIEFNDSISGDKIGFATGGKKTAEGYPYTEIVLFNSVNDDLSPDFTGDKYYFLEGMPVSFLPNPNYDYAGASSNPKKSTDIFGTITNIINTLIGAIGLFGKKKSTAPAEDPTEQAPGEKDSGEPQKETFVAKYGIYLFSGLTIVIVGTVIYLVTKNVQKKKLAQLNAVVPSR